MKPKLDAKSDAGNKVMWKELEPVFIELIKQRPALYDTRSYYRAGRRKVMEVAWKEVATEICVDVKQCKLKWKSIRDNYVRRFKTKDVFTKSCYIVLDHSLTFLNDIILENGRRVKKQKTTKSSNCSPEILIPDSNSSTDTVEDVEINLGNATVVTKEMIESFLEQKTQENTDMDIESQIVNEMFCKNLEDTIDKHTEPSPNQYPYVEAVETPSTSQMCMNIETTDASNLVIENICTLRPVSPTLMLPEVTPSVEILNDEVKEECEKEQLAERALDLDDIQTESFFHEMGAFVASRFSRKKQTEIRLKILSIVTNAELEVLEENDED